jgi:hypothetical protein
VLVVIVGQLLEDLLVIEEVLEDPMFPYLENGDLLTFLDYIECVGLQGEISLRLLS